MSEIDWSKAPEWAIGIGRIGLDRHWVWFDCEKYQYIDGRQGGRSYKFDIEWKAWTYNGLTETQKRPSPAWSGEGLPPVGTVCEWEHAANKGTWNKAEIKYIGSAYVIVADFAGIEQHYYLRSMRFRPIRTPEQIAADEREQRALDLFRIAWPETHRWSDLSPHWHEAFYRLADSAYRKP